MWRVLAFEDHVDIEAMLISGGVNMDEVHFVQRWTTEDALLHIAHESPDVLLLDHFIPPLTGLEVLLSHLSEAEAGGRRVPRIVAMSSEASCNDAMMAAGADEGVVKHRLAGCSFWSSLATGR